MMGFTGGRFWRASPTPRAKSSYTLFLIRVITSTASNTLMRTPRHVSLDPTLGWNGSLTVASKNRHTGNAAVNKFMYDFYNRSIYGGCLQILI